MAQSECPECGNQEEALEIESGTFNYHCIQCDTIWNEEEIEGGEKEITIISYGTFGTSDETPP